MRNTIFFPSAGVTLFSMSGIEELLQSARDAHAAHPDTPLAIATLYAVEGSSYRQPGARLLVDGNGRVLAGAISGGCLEGDVAARAQTVCASGMPEILVYDLRADLQSIWGFDARCDGVAHVLLEPLPDLGWLESAEAWRAARTPGMLITMVNGAFAGTHDAQRLPSALRAPAATLMDAAALTGLPVGGELDVDGERVRCLIAPVLPPISLVLVGAGRGAESFAAIAHALAWKITLVDHRPFVLESVALPAGATRVAARAETGIQHVPADAYSAVALLTHQFEHDQEWLARLLPLPIRYVGVLGSRHRADELLESVAARGLVISSRMKRMLHAPIGLDLGGESPESIALAAIAEIEATMHGRPGGSLRERQSPIHTRTPIPQIAP